MSLRAFHLVFISITTIFCIAVAIWSLYFNAQTTDLGIKILGWSCAIGAAILPVYGVNFFRKSKRQHLTS